MATLKKKMTFNMPDRYPSTINWAPENVSEIKNQELTTNEAFNRIGGTTGRIEAQREGEQEVTVREAPMPQRQNPPAPTTKPEWKIDGLVCLKQGAGIKVRATEMVSGRQVDVGLEPYYDTYRMTRGDIQAISKLLLKTFEDKGIEVTTQRRTPKPDLMEEMYQLLSIMMANPNVAEKYDSPWQTVKTQFDNSLL